MGAWTAETSITCSPPISQCGGTIAGTYTLSPNTAAYLVQSSRAYYGDYLRYQMGRQFYHRMGALPDVMLTGEAPSYASWFSDPATAARAARSVSSRRRWPIASQTVKLASIAHTHAATARARWTAACRAARRGCF